MSAELNLLGQIFKQAQGAHKAQNFVAAEQGYLDILKRDPECGPALEYLGLLYAQINRLSESELYLIKASELMPDKALIWCNLGEIRRKIGRFSQARLDFEKSITLEPTMYQALFNWAIVEEQRNDDAKAEALYRSVLALKAVHQGALINLSSLYLKQQNAEKALPLLLQLKQEGFLTPALLTNIGLAYMLQAHSEKASFYWQEALKLNPSFIPALKKMAHHHERLKEFELALDYFKRIAELKPQELASWLEPKQAFKNKAHHNTTIRWFLNALDYFPEELEIHNELAILFNKINAYDKAIQAFQRVLQITPDDLLVHHNLASLYEQQGNLTKASEHYQVLLEAYPDSNVLKLHVELMSPVILPDQESVDLIETRLHKVVDSWLNQAFKLNFSELKFFTGQSICFYTYFTRGSARELREKLCQLFGSQIQRFTPIKNTGLPHLGFLVTRGHEGIFLRWFSRRFNSFPQGRFRFTIFADQYGLHHKIKPKIQHPDFQFQPIPVNIEQAAHTVHQQGCDVLHFWENGTDLNNFLLPLFRLAPIQITSGWPVTSGNPEIDYYSISQDEYLNSGLAEASFSETLLNITSLGIPPKPSFPKEHKTPSELGLPENKRIYLCLQNLLKIHPDFDWAINEILLKDLEAVIVFVSFASEHIQALLHKRFHKTCAKVIDRIVFIPRLAFNDYLGLLKSVELILDPFHYSGSTTSVDAIWAETPIISLPSNEFRGRDTYGYFHAMNIFDTMATDPADYVDKVLYFGQSPEAREQLRAKIRLAVERGCMQTNPSDAELASQYLDTIEILIRKHLPESNSLKE